MNSSASKILATVLLAVFALLAVTGLIGAAIGILSTDDDQTEQGQADSQVLTETTALSAAAEPYRQVLEQAAEQCPTVHAWRHLPPSRGVRSHLLVEK